MSKCGISACEDAAFSFFQLICAAQGYTHLVCRPAGVLLDAQGPSVIMTCLLYTSDAADE